MGDDGGVGRLVGLGELEIRKEARERGARVRVEVLGGLEARGGGCAVQELVHAGNVEHPLSVESEASKRLGRRVARVEQQLLHVDGVVHAERLEEHCLGSADDVVRARRHRRAPLLYPERQLIVLGFAQLEPDARGHRRVQVLAGERRSRVEHLDDGALRGRRQRRERKEHVGPSDLRRARRAEERDELLVLARPEGPPLLWQGRRARVEAGGAEPAEHVLERAAGEEGAVGRGLEALGEPLQLNHRELIGEGVLPGRWHGRRRLGRQHQEGFVNDELVALQLQ